jgi:hypothetical protein
MASCLRRTSCSLQENWHSMGAWHVITYLWGKPARCSALPIGQALQWCPVLTANNAPRAGNWCVLNAMASNLTLWCLSSFPSRERSRDRDRRERSRSRSRERDRRPERSRDHRERRRSSSAGRAEGGRCNRVEAGAFVLGHKGAEAYIPWQFQPNPKPCPAPQPSACLLHKLLRPGCCDAL